MEYLILVGFIKGIVDGVKGQVAINEWWTKFLVVALSAVFTFAYNLNAMAAVGHPSNVPALDRVVTVIAVAILAMGGSDILAFISKTQRALGLTVRAKVDTAPAPEKKV